MVGCFFVVPCFSSWFCLLARFVGFFLCVVWLLHLVCFALLALFLFVWSPFSLFGDKRDRTPIPPSCGCSFFCRHWLALALFSVKMVFLHAHTVFRLIHARTPDPLSRFPLFVSLFFLSLCPRTCNWVSIHIYTRRLLLFCGGVRRPPPRRRRFFLTNYKLPNYQNAYALQLLT